MAATKAKKATAELIPYELMVIVKPLLPEDVRANVQKSLVGSIEKMGGNVSETDVWGKRHLAYPIATHDEGYYIVYKCSLPQSEIVEFSNQLNLNTDILRFLLVKQD